METKDARLRVGAGAGVVLLVLLLALPFLPRLPKDELVRTSMWGLALLASFAGWGGVVARLARQSGSAALRMAWGASLFVAVGGCLGVLSLVSSASLLLFVGGGIAFLVRGMWRNRANGGRRTQAYLRAARIDPPVALALAGVGLLLLVHYLGAASDTSANPFDDDLAYYPFAKALLQTGTLIDPFSFRRMSTLGGQALFHAALLIRIPIAHLNVFDRGMSILIAVGLLASHRPGRRAVPLLARVAAICVLLLLPSGAINSASSYSGLALFLAFFQSLELLPDEPATSWISASRRVLPLALSGAALCTLRQNYQLTVVLFGVASWSLLALRRWRIERSRVLVEPAAWAALTTVLVAPWLVILYRSSHTFLFPLVRGTLRAGVGVTASSLSPLSLVRFFADVWLHPDPLHTLPLFLLVGVFIPGQSARRTLGAQWIAGFLSLVVLVVSFSLSNATDLARYDFAFFAASALLTWQHATRPGATRTMRALLPAVLLGFALFSPLFEVENQARTRKLLATRLRDLDEMLRRNVAPQRDEDTPMGRTYARLQAAVPERAPLLVMLDQPYHLDFRRNPVLNLDMPGLASPAPGIPAFVGPEAVAGYLLAKGIRYVAFVDPERSHFQYRSAVWRDHLYDAEEIWRVYAPYMTDVMDNLVKLAATHRRLAESADMVVIDLASPP